MWNEEFFFEYEQAIRMFTNHHSTCFTFRNLKADVEKLSIDVFSRGMQHVLLFLFLRS